MRTILLGLGAVLLTGVMFVLCLPLGEIAPLAFVALVPLLLVTRGRGFIGGFLGGLGAILIAAWLGTTGVLYGRTGGEVNDGWIYTGFGIFGFSFAVTFAVWADRSTARFPAWWFAALATLLESVLLVELPSHLALSQYRNAAMVQLASVGGIWFVTFLVWWANFALAEALASPAWKTRVLPVSVAVALAILLGGAWLPSSGTVQRLAALQIAEPDEASLRRMHDQASQDGAALVVWPEFGGMMLAPGGDTTGLRGFGGAPFVTSFPDDAAPLPHNIASRFAGGIESVRYEKRKLFGGEKRMHTAGSRAAVAGDVGLNVCFDSCFPAVIRDSALLGATVVALPTTDPPSTHHFIAAIHAAYTPFRAAESGVAFVRSDGNAYSQIVDARGRIVAEARPGDTVLSAEASVGPRWTLYRLLGDWFLLLCGALAIGYPLRQRLKARKGVTESRRKIPV